MTDTGASNLTPLYVVGKRRGNKRDIVLIELTPFDIGWRQRCSDDPTLNVNYVCKEKVKQLREWLSCDCTRFSLYWSLEEAMECRTTLFATH